MGWREAVDAALEGPVVPSFSRIGYAARRRLYAWRDLDELSMDGKVALVTGASAGLGSAAARQMARMGARLRLLIRNPERGERARERIVAEVPGADVRLYAADLSSLGSVREAVAEIGAGEERLDVLINNAGALMRERRESVDDYEMTFATMVLGPFVLTRGLLPLLQASAPARVIWVSSGGMYTQRLRVADLQMGEGEYKGSVAYARAKRAQVVLSRAWADRLQGTGVVMHAMHPGWADTGGVKASLPTFHKVMGPILRSAEQGADTIAWLAAAEEPGRTTGLFWHDRRPRSIHRLARTREGAEEARRLCAELIRMSAG